MNICFVCNEHPPARHGGIGNMTRTLSRSLVEAGHHVRVIGISAWEDPAPEFEEDQGVQVWRKKVKPSRFSWIRARSLVFRTVKEWAQQGLIELVELPDFEGMAAGWPRLPIPVVVRMHGTSTYFADEMGGRPKRVTRLLERAALRRADFLCSCSRYTAARTGHLFQLKGREITPIHNPTDLSDSPAGEPRSRGEIVFSGTLTPKKGVVSLIRAWPAVVAEEPAAALHLFGKDGRTESGASMRAYLLASLPAKCRNSVHFHGHTDMKRLRSAFRSATAAIFPSYSEAFALAPMEAMSEACPTVFTRRASGPELITDGEDGLLVDPDQPGEISEALLRILRDDQLAAKLGRQGRATIEGYFSLTALLPRNVEFYSHCIHSFGGSATQSKTEEPYAPAVRAIK